jgi:predicted membrane protein
MVVKFEGKVNRTGLLPGLLFVLVGSVILLNRMGYIQTERLWKFWPILLIAVGLVKFFKDCNRVFGALMILLGGVLQLNNLGYTRLSWWDLWPIFLIGIGIMLILSRFEAPEWKPFNSPVAGIGKNSLNEVALFGGVERRIHDNNFRGGSINAMFGSVEIDFRSAEIEGEEAILNAEAIFGGIELIVPERWKVVYEGQSILGGYSDETRPPIPDPFGDSKKKTLLLRGRAIFGGIVVKN